MEHFLQPIDYPFNSTKVIITFSVTMNSLLSLAQTDLDRRVFEHFLWICSIPHGSGNCLHLGDKIQELAQSWGCETSRDPVGNLLIKKAATVGKEDRPTVMLQAHLDMGK
ncbi:hypothetical protein RCL1_005873 [Eukaryota sp. TZLM3-RCL]